MPKPKSVDMIDALFLESLDNVLCMRFPSIEAILSGKGYRYEAGLIWKLREAAIQNFPENKNRWESKPPRAQ